MGMQGRRAHEDTFGRAMIRCLGEGLDELTVKKSVEEVFSFASL